MLRKPHIIQVRYLLNESGNGWNECVPKSQFRIRPVRFRILDTRRRRDVGADFNRARPVVRVIDFERMPALAGMRTG